MTLGNAGAGRRLMARLDEFSQFTDEPGRLTRLYLSPSYRGACERLAEWIREAGLEPEIDPAGNVRATLSGGADWSGPDAQKVIQFLEKTAS